MHERRGRKLDQSILKHDAITMIYITLKVQDGIMEELNPLNPTPLVTVEEFFCLSILEGTTGNEIDPDKNHHCYNKNYICFPPFFSEIPQQACFASIAIVTKLVLVIVPQIAIWVCHSIRWVYPQHWVHIIVPTCSWRFTTS